MTPEQLQGLWSKGPLTVAESYRRGDLTTGDVETLKVHLRASHAVRQHERSEKGRIEKGHVVYYVRFCCRVKIGTAGDLEKRLQAIPHDEVLATEPGSYQTEHARHREFEEYRLAGEWFEYGSRLKTHIKTLNGQPPILVSTDLAATHIGRDSDVIYRWAREGRITRHGGTDPDSARWDLRELPGWDVSSGLPMPNPPPIGY